MDKKKLFAAMLQQAKNEKFHYIGTGNPNAKILIVGKEAAIDDEVQKKREITNNIEDWKRDKDKQQSDIQNWNSADNYSPLYPYKGKHDTSKTWMNYQKLKNLIFDTKSDTIDFHENFFITEINEAPSKKTANADASSITDRKRFIAKSEYFQSFPVVVLAGLGYYEITDNRNEIEEIFNVKFTEKHCADSKDTQAYWVHWSSNKSKLVINTRQLSINISDQLLKEVAEVIKQSDLC